MTQDQERPTTFTEPGFVSPVERLVQGRKADKERRARSVADAIDHYDALNALDFELRGYALEDPENGRAMLKEVERIFREWLARAEELEPQSPDLAKRIREARWSLEVDGDPFATPEFQDAVRRHEEAEGEEEAGRPPEPQQHSPDIEPELNRFIHMASHGKTRPVGLMDVLVAATHSTEQAPAGVAGYFDLIGADPAKIRGVARLVDANRGTA